MNSTVGALEERAACDRVILWGVPWGGANFLFFCTPPDCFSISYQRGRLRNGDGEGKGEDTSCELLSGRGRASGRHVEWKRSTTEQLASVQGNIRLSG